MARRPSKHLRPARPLLGGGAQRKAVRGGVEYVVRDVPGDRAAKSYTCPGCAHVVAPGTAHVVAWPVAAPFGSDTGIDVRRHWHRHCWGRP
ncbi:MAG: hypothetical protein QM713_02050 [Arachnia sp.]